jgi:methionine synthase II (cobalamin-independent)
MDFSQDSASIIDLLGIDVIVDGVPARGIFDNDFASAFSGLVGGSSPVLHLVSSVPVARGSAVIVAGVTYTVTGVEPDGTGVTQLRMDKE